MARHKNSQTHYNVGKMRPITYKVKPIKVRVAATRSRFSVDYGALWHGKSQTGNRSSLRAAKLLGVLDGSTGVSNTRTASAREIGPGANQFLREIAYDAGFARGASHRRFIKALGAGQAHATGKVTKPGTRRAAQAMTQAWRQGDAATIHGFAAGHGLKAVGSNKDLKMVQTNYRGRGRNEGSFRARPGEWTKGAGGRFSGSKGK